MEEHDEGLLYYASAYNTSSTDTGLTPTEEPSELKDREVNVVFSRDDDGCKDAYEHCSDVYNNVERIVSLYNSGIVVKSIDDKLYKKEIVYLQKRRRELEIDTFLDFALTNRELYCIGAIGKKFVGKKIKHLVGIRTANSSRTQYEFIPVIDSLTGKLGVKGIDPNNGVKSVVAVQKACPTIYDTDGNTTTGDIKNTYFDENTLMMINYGKSDIWSKVVSPVRRSLRYAEALVRLENTVALLARRPTQLIYIAGNENHNLLNCEIPRSYIEDADNDRVQARINYKTDKLSDLATQAKNLTAGNVLAQVLEFGTDVKSIEVPEGLPYIDYLRYYSDKIKMCILPVDIPTQRIVRSAKQEGNFVSELIEKAESEQRKIKDWLNNNLTSILLQEIGSVSIDKVWYDFEPIKKVSEEEKARHWFYLARATEFFLKSTRSIPDGLKELVGDIEISDMIDDDMEEVE